MSKSIVLQSDSSNNQNITLQSFDSHTSRVTNDEPVKIAPMRSSQNVNVEQRQSVQSKEKAVVIIYLYFFQFFMQSFSSQHPGHLKPFGSSGPFDQIDELTDGFPDPISFFKDYVSNLRPVVFRQVLINDPHLSIWDTDENIEKIFANDPSVVYTETRKKESRQQDILTMTMTQFLKRYQNEELYLVDEVPDLLRRYFTLPTCLQCQPALSTFQVAMLWYSSGNTSSVVHTDDYYNINCVLQGDKRFILVDPYTYRDVASEIIDNFSGSYSSIDVDRVDYDKYPSLDNDIHYYQVNLTKGDCIFLPALWIHQVRSSNRNIAVNYWLNHMRVNNAIVDENTCLLLNKSNLVTLEKIRWRTDISNLNSLKEYMFDLIDDDATSFIQWTREFSDELDYNIQSNSQTIMLFAEFFNIIDTNSNGFITSSEVESLFETDDIKEATGILEDILDIVEGKSDKLTASNDTYTDDEYDETFDNNNRVNQTDSDDETEDEEDNIIEHEDL